MNSSSATKLLHGLVTSPDVGGKEGAAGCGGAAGLVEGSLGRRWPASRPQEAALQRWGEQGVLVALGLLLMQVLVALGLLPTRALSSPCPGLSGGAPGVSLLRPAPGLGVLLPSQDLPALPAPVPAAGRRGHLHGVEPEEAGTRHPWGSARASWGPLALAATACPRGAWPRSRARPGGAAPLPPPSWPPCCGDAHFSAATFLRGCLWLCCLPAVPE